jgi:hypothetical protein
MPCRIHLTFERPVRIFQNRPDLVGQSEIPKLARELLEIRMATVPARHFHGERLAEVKKQVMEIVVAVSPVDVSNPDA